MINIEYDSDEEQILKIWKIGDKLDYKYFFYIYFARIEGAYILVEVVDTIKDMLKIKGIEVNLSKWIFFDDDNIAPYNTAKLFYKNNVEFFKY